MNMPKNYENTAITTEYEMLTLGGHKCKVIKVEEAKSQSGRDMIKVYLDTDKTDAQPQFYKKRYDADTRDEKKWGCIMYVMVTDSEGNCNKNLKAFHTAVEESNKGFSVVWGDKYADAFKNKLVGIVFGEEEYLNAKGELKTTTKPFFFNSIAKVLDAKIPNKRTLSDDKKSTASTGFVPSSVVMQPTSEADIPDPTDDDYPF